ncbi:DUF2207 domain-containing protein [Microbacterium sp. RURRCA19A]|uniref:DUF2207 domain-containing protein n=1 Tax=Microbacterium sp. RURRCA19A TaxID=1907391 RepID=UPI0009555381|nr:DUF2207 domain-containing protein [Microbacterium sp. RURRCA19A]SIR76996.1 Predicted membrane protein [Microbacterium sp. RURRCA19A]
MDVLASRVRSLRAALTAAALLCVLLTVLPTAPAHADVDDFRFDSLDARMSLTRAADGHAELSVTETLVAEFPEEDQNRGIIRVIPDDYDGVPLQTRITAVTGADGAAIPFEVETDRREVRVLTGDDDYVHGRQTYVISYTQRDTIRAFADTDADEFYRDVNGTDWAQPFGRVDVEVTVDASLAAAALDGAAACYRGAQGSSDRCDVTRTDRADGGLTFSAGSNDLGPGENVTIAVGFASGTFVPGEVVRTAAEQFSVDAAPALAAVSLGTLGLSAVAIGAAIVSRRRNRDAAGRGIIVAEYTPPAGVDVLEGAHLVGRSPAALPAAVLDTAVAGHLRIVESPSADDALALEYVDAAGATPLRAGVLAAVFGDHPRPGERVALDTPGSDAGARLRDMLAVAGTEVRRRGWMRRPQMRGAVAAGVIAVAAFGVSVAALMITAVGATPTWWQIAAIPTTVVGGILTFVLIRYSDRVTDAGAPVRDHLLGLRDYLTLAEADRLRVLQSPEGAERRSGGTDDPVQVLHLYEKLLPWAVVWGVEREWADVLAVQAQATGTELGWYSGPNGFSSALLASSLSTMHSGTSPAPTTSGSGSFSGGSFGGGFSGGGMGGGGGGGR